MDYKTAMHHVEILMEHGLVRAGEKKYGGLYFATEFFEANLGLLQAIWGKLGKSK